VPRHLSVICNEAVPRIPDEETTRQHRGFGAMIPTVVRICSSWPKRPVPESLFAPLRTDTPTLILSGEIDPATTVSAANRLAETLPRARHIVFPATAHAPPFPACATEAIARFVETASTVDVNPDCSDLKLPRFANAVSGP